MSKIGNGNNIQETIENYMKKINEVQNENNNLKKYYFFITCKEKQKIQKLFLHI